jgi:hypothetical protein
MLWNSLVCLDHFNVKTLSLEIWGSNLDGECWGFQTLIVNFFYFIKTLAQIRNNFEKF